MSGDNPGPTDRDYEQLLALRDELRRFLHWSEEQAREAGLTPAQHQLLLAVRGHRGDPTVGDIAAHLLLRHNSVVGLIDRAQEAGLIQRRVDPANHRVARVALTPRGRGRLAVLAAAHLEELDALRARLAAVPAPEEIQESSPGRPD